MEQERKAREAEEKERAERMKKIKDQFADPNGQWEKDKSDIQNEAMEEKAKDSGKEAVQEKSAEEDSGPVADQAPAEADARADTAKPQEQAEVMRLYPSFCLMLTAGRDQSSPEDTHLI